MLVIVKLILNIIDIIVIVEVVVWGGVDVVSMINIINSLVGVDIYLWNMILYVVGKGVYGGYCGLVVKLIVLNMVVECVRSLFINVLILGMGGVLNW